MQMKVIDNPDVSQRTAYRIARVIYAETGGVSLRCAEAMASMIANVAIKTSRDINDVISDNEIFDSNNPKSVRHAMQNVDANNRGLQMCLRVTKRLLHGMLPDCCCGATRFHHDDIIPDWATSRGYIADIDGLLFYA